MISAFIKKINFLLFSTVLLSTLNGCNNNAEKLPIAPNIATTINLNSDWQFQKSVSENNNADNWQTVSLPHTPKIEPMVVNDQWQGIAWYQKTLTAPKEWQHKKIFIRFEAAMSHAEVFLNGVKIGEHLGGYLPFTLELNQQLKFGEENILSVKLNNQDNPIIGPKPLKTLDFNTYGGLYRSVNLLVKNPLHITDEMYANEVASGGIFITTPKVSEQLSSINIKTHIANSQTTKQSFTLKQQLYFNEQLITEHEETALQLAGNARQQFTQNLTVKNAKLWSPSAPNLYHVKTELYQNEQLIEQQTTRVGIRKFTFNTKHELLINGKKTFLRGVNRHQEYPHVGYATSPLADYRDAVKIKSAGFDYVRLSHYPHSKAFMNAADELGLVLIDAILGWQYYLEDPNFKQQIIRTCHDLIRRDRNHASVLAWECSLNESWMPKEFIADLHAVVKQEDPNGFSAGWQHGYDLYLQARQHRLQEYETPHQPYNVSEYGDWEYYAQNAGLNQDSWGDLKEEERTSRQLLNAGEARLLQQARNLQEAHNDNLTIPAFADGYWVMFDYNRGYADDLEASGIMSIYRLPKYSYYFYQSQRDASEQSPLYQSGPMVHIASEWTEKSSTTVRVFSNAEEVELWLNEELISKNKPLVNELSSHLPHPPFEFSLGSFTAGKLVAKAYINNEVVATHQINTPAKASTLEITIDKSGAPLATGIKDVAFVYANVIDQHGNKVPVNNQDIIFESTGDIMILNTDIPKTEQGTAAVLIQIGDSLIGASIKATSSDKLLSSKIHYFK